MTGKLNLRIPLDDVDIPSGLQRRRPGDPADVGYVSAHCTGCGSWGRVNRKLAGVGPRVRRITIKSCVNCRGIPNLKGMIQRAQEAKNVAS